MKDIPKKHSHSIKLKKLVINLDLNESMMIGSNNKCSKAMSRWKKISNLIKTINKMKTFEIKEINSLREIDIILKHNISGGLKKASTQVVASDYFDNTKLQKFQDISMVQLGFREDTIENLMNEMALHAEVMNICSQGDSSMISRLKNIIMNDPKRNLFSNSEKSRYFVNKPNADSQTFLYTACLNGHLKVVKLLLDCDADHLMKYGIGRDAISVLDAAVRWNHLKLVEFLIDENEFKLDWPRDYLLSAIKISTSQNNRHMTKLLKSKKYVRKSSSCFFICSN